MSDGFDGLVVLWTSGLAKRQRSLKKHMFDVVSPASPLYPPFRGILRGGLAVGLTTSPLSLVLR